MKPTTQAVLSEDWTYEGRELKAMSVAVNYHRWILQRFMPFLGKKIVEVGAGIGSFANLLLETKPEQLTLLEPSTNMYPILVERLARMDKTTTATARQSQLTELLFDKASPVEPPDSILYVNVLEHVEDDETELHAAYSLLASGGRVLIFVPANPWLMGSIDRQFGHFRRYTMKALATKCRSAGFTVRAASYFDLLGIFPWWLRYCVLKSDQMEPSAVRFYDRWFVPVSRTLETFATPPIGKNIILIGEKAKN
jgi:2-polyprenyl-3-methyl-5-hydroxy-6-metoxy-1,4-benzoquinol methylase